MKTYHRSIKPYMNPYLAGVGLGATLLMAFVIMGRGLGASGGFTSILTALVEQVSSTHANSNSMYRGYLNNEFGSPLFDWLVFEMAGMIFGALVSGYFAGRLKFKIDKGEFISSRGRIILAFTGGSLMGFAAKIARGCTSGQALTGGSLLNLGSWIFMISVFAGAFLFAPAVRRQWK